MCCWRERLRNGRGSLCISPADMSSATLSPSTQKVRPLLGAQAFPPSSVSPLTVPVHSVSLPDSCHTLTCALMLLNNDLHGQVGLLVYLIESVMSLISSLCLVIWIPVVCSLILTFLPSYCLLRLLSLSELIIML